MKAWIRKVLPKKSFPVAQRIYHNMRSLFYMGNNLECPICGGHFRKFLTFGVVPKPNAVCPRCTSHGRHRLLWLYLRDRTDFFRSNLKVLYFAPMNIFQHKMLKMKNLDYCSADIDSPLAMTKQDITDINIPDDSFDCIICYHVFEHVLDDEKAMKEVFRILRPGGWAILQVPIDQNRERTFEDPDVTTPEEREKVFGHWEHVRIYGLDYRERLAGAGFSVKEDRYATELDPQLARKYSIGTEEIIHFCTKPVK